MRILRKGLTMRIFRKPCCHRTSRPPPDTPAPWLACLLPAAGALTAALLAVLAVYTAARWARRRSCRTAVTGVACQGQVEMVMSARNQEYHVVSPEVLDEVLAAITLQVNMATRNCAATGSQDPETRGTASLVAEAGAKRQEVCHDEAGAATKMKCGEEEITETDGLTCAVKVQFDMTQVRGEAEEKRLDDSSHVMESREGVEAQMPLRDGSNVTDSEEETADCWETKVEATCGGSSDIDLGVLHSWHDVTSEVIVEEDEPDSEEDPAGPADGARATADEDWLDTVVTRSETVLVMRMPWEEDSLFAALAHQIYEPPVGSSDHMMYTSMVRMLAVRYLRSNRERYWDQILEAVENQGSRYPGVSTEEWKVERYLGDLGRPGFPGGAECLCAVADALDMDVLVYVEGLAKYPVTSSRGRARRTVAVAKRRSGGPCSARFDSVVAVDSSR
ncbi:uncharacterized protein LOC134540087 [Bacillus rossius redtenbacheri]|uniref:uncharacterized protein LOC134540087 n=1 Tax=Bacillus rossius redtenbacheri TaxID=93214 RepID=UPI002FDC7CF5